MILIQLFLKYFARSLVTIHLPILCIFTSQFDHFCFPWTFSLTTIIAVINKKVVYLYVFVTISIRVIRRETGSQMGYPRLITSPDKPQLHSFTWSRQNNCYLKTKTKCMALHHIWCFYILYGSYSTHTGRNQRSSKKCNENKC